jgi:hypothetical protein
MIGEMSQAQPVGKGFFLKQPLLQAPTHAEREFHPGPPQYISSPGRNSVLIQFKVLGSSFFSKYVVILFYLALKNNSRLFSP